MEFENGHVDYESFGAVGDGVADDLQAIVDAHAYANEHGLPVRTRPEATYHLGYRALTVTIATDTDWNTSRFTIDDSDTEKVEDHKANLFRVVSLLEPEALSIERLERDQKQLDAKPSRDCWVRVENDQKRLYIRRGLNQNNGSPQHDCFILRSDGTIDSPVDWNYDIVTKVDARPIEENRLVVRGGIFTTFANRMVQEVGYNYWSRNIAVSRSNTEVNGLTHYVVGETSVGHPYSGFLNVGGCADVTLRDCFSTGHRIYSTIGAAGKPVNMGSYDLSAHDVVNFRMIGCRMNHITDRTRWGVIGSNFCRNILLEDCTLSRMDTHQGVSGTYTIRRCTLGHVGLNAIGRGTLTVEDSTIYGRSFVNFRADYGSTWEGDVVIRNSRWIPACGEETWPRLIGASNDGTHDFGYPCSLPTEIRIDGLEVDDSNHPEGYEGLYLLSDPESGADGDLPEERPFPYAPTRRIVVRGLSAASGKQPSLSPNRTLFAQTEVVFEN